MNVIKIGALSFILIAASAGQNALNAQALKCDTVRPLPGSSSGYQPRENRCEGLYVADVGVRSIDIVSLTYGNLAFSLQARLPLRVSVQGQTQPLNIRAVAIPPRTYYRMDAPLRPGVVLVWPITDVLLPENLTDSRIGIFGWRGTESSKTFVPVRVVTDKSPSPAPQSQPILLSIQTSFDAETIKWRSARFQAGACLAFDKWRDATSHLVPAGSALQINLKQLPEKMNCVEIAARSRDSNDWVTLMIHVEIPAP